MSRPVVPWAVSAETRRVRRAMRDLPFREHRVALNRHLDGLPVDPTDLAEAKAALTEALAA